MMRTFPKLPTFRATWAPVYLEPILHSGERITAGIAVTGGNGETLVVPTLSGKQLSCIYGEKDGSSLFNIVQMTLDSLSEHLKESPSILSWEAPFSGISLGQHHETFGDDLLSVATIAMRFSASFSRDLTDGKQDLSADAIAAQAIEDDRWPKRIYDAVVGERPDFKDYFNRTVSIFQGAPPSKFDFLGRRYVSNFGRLIPAARSLSRMRSSAKARLWDLARLREAPGIRGNVTALEFIIWRPRPDDMAYSEGEMKALSDTIFELQEAAKAEDLKTVPVYTVGEASDRIILNEAA